MHFESASQHIQYNTHPVQHLACVSYILYMKSTPRNNITHPSPQQSNPHLSKLTTSNCKHLLLHSHYLPTRFTRIPLPVLAVHFYISVFPLRHRRHSALLLGRRPIPFTLPSSSSKTLTCVHNVNSTVL